VKEVWEQIGEEVLLKTLKLSKKHKKECCFMVFIREEERKKAEKGKSFKVEITRPALGTKESVPEFYQIEPGVFTYKEGEGFWSPPFSIDLLAVHTHVLSEEREVPALPSLFDLYFESSRMLIAKKLSKAPFLWVPAGGVINVWREEIVIFRTPYPLKFDKVAQKMFRHLSSSFFFNPIDYWPYYEKFIKYVGIKMCRFPIRRWKEMIPALCDNFPFLVKISEKNFWYLENAQIKI